MAVTLQTYHPSLIPGTTNCGLCKQPLKPNLQSQSPKFKPRHNKIAPRMVAMPKQLASQTAAQVQKIVGHGISCRFHKACSDRHLEKEPTCFTCKKRVVVSMSDTIKKEIFKALGAGVYSYTKSLLGAGLAMTPEVVMRLSLTAFSVLEANGLINPVIYHLGSPELISVMLRTTVFAFLLFGVDSLADKIHLPTFISDTQKKIILYAGTIFTFPFICNFWKAPLLMGLGFMAQNAIVTTIKKDGFLSSSQPASVIGVIGAMLTLRSLLL